MYINNKVYIYKYNIKNTIHINMNDFNYTKNYIMKNILKRSQTIIIEDMHNGGLF